MLLKGMWNILNLNRVHPASFRAQTLPLSLCKQNWTVWECYSKAVSLVRGLVRNPGSVCGYLGAGLCAEAPGPVWPQLARVKHLTRAKQSCKYLLQGPQLCWGCVLQARLERSHLPCEELKQGLGVCQGSGVDPQRCLPSWPGPARRSQGGRSCAGSVRPSVIRYVLESS